MKKTQINNIETTLLKEYEWEYAQNFFGQSLFLNKRSTREVYHGMSETDKELFKKIASIKGLSLTAQWELMAESLEHTSKNKPIPDAIKEKLIANALSSVASTLAFDYLRRYDTQATYGDFIGEGYLALVKTFDKWMFKTEKQKLHDLTCKKAIFATFNTFAYPWVKDAYAVMLSRESKLTASLSTQKKIKKMAFEKARFIKTYGYVPSTSELAQFCGATEKEVNGAYYFLSRISTGDLGETSQKDIYVNIQNAQFKAMSDAQEEALRTKVIKKYLVKILNKAEYEIVNGIIYNDKTREELAKQMGLSVHIINTMYKNSIKRLQENKIVLKEMLQEQNLEG